MGHFFAAIAALFLSASPLTALPTAAVVDRGGVVVHAPVSPAETTVAVWCDYAGGSGTCVATDGGKSLVVTNNHIFSTSYDADGGFGRAPYPIQGKVIHKGRTYTAKAIDGVKSSEGDLAIMVVDGELPVAELATSVPALGSRVRHWGVRTGPGIGIVLANPINTLWPNSKFTSSASTASGDSGAGFFDDYGRLVAVNCGLHSPRDGERQRGTPIETVKKFLKEKAAKWRTQTVDTPPPKKLPTAAVTAPPAAAPTTAPTNLLPPPVGYRYGYIDGKLYLIPCSGFR